MMIQVRRGDRAVEGSSLENCRASNGTEGSNPSLSAKKNTDHLVCIFLTPSESLSRIYSSPTVKLEITKLITAYANIETTSPTTEYKIVFLAVVILALSPPEMT